MTPQEFIHKWKRANLSERSAYQQHFLMGHPRDEIPRDPAWPPDGGRFLKARQDWDRRWYNPTRQSTLDRERGSAMSFHGTVQNGVVVLDEQQQLPDGTRVEVIVHDSPVKQPTLRERLAKLAGTVDDLPEDMARNHDHYIHGAPKK